MSAWICANWNFLSYAADHANLWRRSICSKGLVVFAAMICLLKTLTLRWHECNKVIQPFDLLFFLIELNDALSNAATVVLLCSLLFLDELVLLECGLALLVALLYFEGWLLFFVLIIVSLASSGTLIVLFVDIVTVRAHQFQILGCEKCLFIQHHFDVFVLHIGSVFGVRR